MLTRIGCLESWADNGVSSRAKWTSCEMSFASAKIRLELALRSHCVDDETAYFGPTAILDICCMPIGSAILGTSPLAGFEIRPAFLDGAGTGQVFPEISWCGSDGGCSVRFGDGSFRFRDNGFPVLRETLIRPALFLARVVASDRISESTLACCG